MTSYHIRHGLIHLYVGYVIRRDSARTNMEKDTDTDTAMIDLREQRDGCVRQVRVRVRVQLAKTQIHILKHEYEIEHAMKL